MGQPFVPPQPPAAARAPDAASTVEAVFVRWHWIRMCLNILARPNHMQRIVAWIRIEPVIERGVNLMKTGELEN